MTPIMVVATLVLVLYCLWVRRATWWSRWEAAATLAIAMEALALLLFTPWAGIELGPTLHSWLGLWNVQQIVGFICLIAGVLANIYHMLVRLADPDQVLPIMRSHLQLPVGLGVGAVLVAFVKTDRGSEPDIFATLTGDRWLTLLEVAASALVLFLSAYVGRLLLALRDDPRAGRTLHLYMAAMVFAVAACVVAVVSIGIGCYSGPLIWACLCMSVGTFAYGLARSWQAKTAWFLPDSSAPR